MLSVSRYPETLCCSRSSSPTSVTNTGCVARSQGGTKQEGSFMEIHTQESPLVWECLIGLTKAAIKKVLGRRHMSLPTLETITVEIGAILNDRPLTFVSSDLGDPEPFTPSHLLHGRRITCLPHQDTDIDELVDPTYREASQIHKRARLQAAILGDFKKRWCHQYLTHYGSTIEHQGTTSDM